MWAAWTGLTKRQAKADSGVYAGIRDLSVKGGKSLYNYE
jgi:hypothetical protein